MPIKILIVFHVFPYYRLQVMRELSRDKDIQYTFLSGSAFVTSIKPIDHKIAETELFQWKTVKNIWWFNGYFLWQSGLIHESLKGDYDGVVFLGNPYFFSTWVAAFLLRLVNKKVFFWTHAIIRNHFRDILKVIYFKLANVLLLYGNAARQNLIDLGFDSEKIYVVYNSLDYESQESMKERLNVANLVQKRKELFLHWHDPVLVFVGRLMPKKQLDYIVDAAGQLGKRGMPVNVLLIGDGVEKENLLNLVERNHLEDRVVFWGECYDEAILSTLIAMSDVCVSPGNVGLTAMHALNYGTPVITHNNSAMQMPEYEAIEPGVTGMLYEYRSVDSLVDTIYTWLLENKDRRECVRAKCYEIIRKFYNPFYQSTVIKNAIIQIVEENAK